MEKTKHGTWVLITIGAFLLLGPFISSESLAQASLLNIPKSYVFIFVVWLMYIILIRLLVQKKS